ncbi:RDD family protein [Allokutzneria albata]|uniref:RDD family protein n=1 Tax=Allokutzneria albata TaxID=211114 RepID=A0A1H0CME2_ALLAB|nr:RDD family protein [Allokutzneria albata]
MLLDRYPSVSSVLTATRAGGLTHLVGAPEPPGLTLDSVSTEPESVTHAGARFGFPAHGPGSLASFGRRILALVVDWLPAAAAAYFLTTNPSLSALVIFAAVTIISHSLFGRTLGYAVAGLRLVKIDGLRPDPGRVLVRTLLLCLVIPAVVSDDDGRGLHDKVVSTAVVSTR